jgi:hypothetical protein
MLFFLTQKYNPLLYTYRVRGDSRSKTRSRVQGNRAILLVESHKLDPQPLDDGEKLKIGQSRLNIHGAIFKGKSIGSH